MKKSPPIPFPGRPVTYEIRVKGILDGKWSDWFDSLAVVPLDCGETLLTGLVADQSALFGLLNKIRDIGLPLLALRQVEEDEP